MSKMKTGRQRTVSKPAHIKQMFQPQNFCTNAVMPKSGAVSFTLPVATNTPTASLKAFFGQQNLPEKNFSFDPEVKNKNSLPVLIAGITAVGAIRRLLNDPKQNGNFLQRFEPGFANRSNFETTMQGLYEITSQPSSPAWMRKRFSLGLRALAANKIVNDPDTRITGEPRFIEHWGRPANFRYPNVITGVTADMTGEFDREAHFIFLNSRGDNLAKTLKGMPLLEVKNHLKPSPTSFPETWPEGSPANTPVIDSMFVERNKISNFNGKKLEFHFVQLDHPAGFASNEAWLAFKSDVLTARNRSSKLNADVRFSRIEFGGEELRRAVNLATAKDSRNFAQALSEFPQTARSYLIATGNSDIWKAGGASEVLSDAARSIPTTGTGPVNLPTNKLSYFEHTGALNAAGTEAEAALGFMARHPGMVKWGGRGAKWGGRVVLPLTVGVMAYLGCQNTAQAQTLEGRRFGPLARSAGFNTLVDTVAPLDPTFITPAVSEDAKSYFDETSRGLEEGTLSKTDFAMQMLNLRQDFGSYVGAKMQDRAYNMAADIAAEKKQAIQDIVNDEGSTRELLPTQYEGIGYIWDGALWAGRKIKNWVHA